MVASSTTRSGLPYTRLGNRPLIMDYIFAGGREMTLRELESSVKELIEAVRVGRLDKPVRWVTVRGEDE